jgi:hypothetical protein
MFCDNGKNRSPTATNHRKFNSHTYPYWAALHYSSKFKFMALPCGNADGVAISVESIPINIGACVIMLAAEPETYSAINEMFAAPVKEA